MYYKYCLLIFLVLIVSCKKEKQKPLIIAAASSMQYVMQDLCNEFEKTTQVETKLVIGSSGKLTAQIEARAPYDIFLSADANYPKYLIGKNKKLSSPSVTFAFGKLVLFSYLKIKGPILDYIFSSEVNRIALPNPKNAPYGKAAKELLEYKGIYKKVKSKLVFAESVSQANQFVVTKAAQVGFTSKSTVLSNKKKVSKMYWNVVPDSLYNPLPQQLLIVTNNDLQYKKAQHFLEFIKSALAQQILVNYGYDIPK